ncbi:MAG: phytoene desaturase family protein [Microscillaceae bacterium]|jgi:phytoene desaturase|nr:phytoene desaturase family protein [Microscillaceae bacterium]
MNKSRTCAIVGAGIAGIAAAIRLANQGFAVTVFEANSYAGGKLSEISANGYRFDAGPSLFTMPQYIEELFALSDKPIQNYFAYKKLAIACQYFYEDGTQLTAFADIEKFAQEVAHKTQDSAETVRSFLQKSAFKYDTTADVFLHQSLHKFTNYLNFKTLRGVLNFYKLDVFRSMNEVNRQAFRDPKMVQFFNRYATYNGSDPYQTPGLMNVIPHLEFGIGAFFPLKGMYSITQSLVRLAEDLGVKFCFNSPVQEILVKNQTAVGLVVGKEQTSHFFDKIVSNMDVVGTYNRLLPHIPKPQKLLTQPKSSSAVIFYWGIKHSFAQLDLHNIFFSADYEAEFRHIFQKQSLYHDPTVYINITSKEKPDDAPEGCENWFVMVNAPHNSGQDWDTLIQTLRQNILKKLSRLLHTDIESLIDCEMLLDPRTIESRTSSAQGALYGNSSNNRYAAFLRHANFSTQIKNLYFCGGSVHPGGGIPLSLLSAKIAAGFVK